jgi:dTDP-4-amino-4,6-dideoxygalactose transaminase
MHIPFVDLKSQYTSIKIDIDRAINNVINDTAFIGGKYVYKFEQNFASLYGVKKCVSCANGTDSLYIIMKMLGIGKGDEVITAANSWISSSETITQVGAKPVFIDAHPVFYSMDENLLESLITPKTKAVIAVHLQGQMCNIEHIKSICDKNNIYLIEDCAQAHFSEFNGKRAGTFGIAGSFSFYPSKNLGAYGDAGCIITNDDAFANKCRMFANHGSLTKHQHQIEGINSRLDGLQAAILNVKLPHILNWTDNRIKNAALYSEKLESIKEVKVPVIRYNTKHTFHLYVIQAEKRDELRQYLEKKGIETAIHYPKILPNLEVYQYMNAEFHNFNVSSQIEARILSLPLYAELKEVEIEYVANCIRTFYN